MTSEDWWVLGLFVLGVLVVASKKTEDDTSEQIGTSGTDDAPSDGGTVGTGGTVNVKLTGYWPFVDNLGSAARLMEGGLTDRKSKPLHTLEDFQAGNAEYVSVSGDDTIWPYGQRIVIANWPDVVFRVVDTGKNFSSLKQKVYRVGGYEPLDICVAGPNTSLAPALTTCTIVVGDNFAVASTTHPQTNQTEVQTDQFQGQSVG